MQFVNNKDNMSAMNVKTDRQMVMHEFRNFLKREVDRAGSARELSRQSGVSHTIINKFIDYNNESPGYPSIDTLVKIAKTAGVDPSELLRMVIADFGETNTITDEDLLLAQQIRQLPAPMRKAIDAFLIGANLAQSDDET